MWLRGVAAVEAEGVARVGPLLFCPIYMNTFIMTHFFTTLSHWSVGASWWDKAGFRACLNPASLRSVMIHYRFMCLKLREMVVVFSLDICKFSDAGSVTKNVLS